MHTKYVDRFINKKVRITFYETFDGHPTEGVLTKEGKAYRANGLEFRPQDVLTIKEKRQ